MAFQDFDHISERRKAERERKFRKKIIIAVVSGLALVALISGGVFAIVTHKSDEKGNTKTPQVPETKQVSHLEKVIKTICNGTMYKETCHNTLTKATNNKTSSAQPKDLLKYAISAASEEVNKAFTKASSLKFNSPEEKAAFEDCRALIETAKEELEESISQVGDNTKLSSKAPDLNNWLSAVMSYQQTCIDGFPEGKLKTDMEKIMKATRELTSNSLAMISGLSKLLSSFSIPGVTSRRLLDTDGFPKWMTSEDRRMLKGANAEKPTPNVTVAKDGSGQFTTINAALAAMPPKYVGRYVIYIKEGIYDETVLVTKKMVNVTMYGDGSQKTIVTGNKNFVDGVRTFLTATFAAEGAGFFAKAMGFRNTAGPEKHQAVAIRVQSDQAIFVNCRFEGYQDTLYAQTHRQYYRSCVIKGTVDFIFGDAAAIFQNCMIYVRKPLPNQQNIVTAQGRVDPAQTTGIVIQSCRILADPDLEPVKAEFRTYLGRPWKEYSRTIIMESTIEDLIHPDGFMPWQGEFALSTLYYAEYNNKGPGAKVDARVKWPGYKKITKQDAMKYTVGPFLGGAWISAMKAPVHFGLYT